MTIEEISKINSLKSQKSIKPNKIIYKTDKSLITASDDKFKHSHYVEVLKDILTKCETPINIGLYGRWGVGKSSIVRMLKEEIKNTDLGKKFSYVEVDTWGLSKDALQQGIIEEINSQLPEEVYSQSEIEDKLYNQKQVEDGNYKKSLKRSWPIGIIFAVVLIISLHFKIDLAAVITILGLGTIISIFLPILKLFQISSRTIIPKAVSSFQFRQIYNEIATSQEKKKKKLVVVIDNLDRCDDHVAVNLLGIIQTFMARENCINILACDDEAIVNHLQQVHGQKYTEREGNEFLSKFFQVTIRVPPFIGNNLSSYVDELMGERDIEFHPSVKRILISGAIKNPRKVNQFLNNIIALYKLAELKEKDSRLQPGAITKHTDFLTKIIILRHEWPSYYKALEKSPELLDPKNPLYIEWLDNFRKELKINKNDESQIEGLTEFLTATRSCLVKDTKSFLLLNQEEYQSLEGIEKFAFDVNNCHIDTVIETIEKLDEKNQEHYIQKICAINDENMRKGDFPSLENSTKTLIGALDVISGDSNKDNALNNLGQHLSSEQILQRLEEYDIEKVFKCTNEMHIMHQEPVFDKILSIIDKNDQLQTNILHLFMKYSTTTPSLIMNKVDNRFDSLYDKFENILLDVSEQTCSTDDWVRNNIRKPSRLISLLINHVILDNSELDNHRLSVLIKIHNTIDKSEKKLIIERLQNIFLQASQNKLLPVKFFDAIQALEIKNYELHYELEQFFVLLAKQVNNMPEIEQRKQLFDIAFTIHAQLKDFLKNDDSLHNLIKSVSEFVNISNHDVLSWLDEIDTKYQVNLFNFDFVSKSYWSNLVRNGISDENLLLNFINKVSINHKDILLDSLKSLFESKNPVQYKILLDLIGKRETKWPNGVLDKLRETMLKTAQDVGHPNNFDLLKAVINSHASSDNTELKNLADEIQKWIVGDDLNVVENALNLIRKINEKIDAYGQQIAVSLCIEQIPSLFQTNRPKANSFINFILDYSNKFTSKEEKQLLNIIKNYLVNQTPPNDLVYFLTLISKLTKSQRSDIFDTVIELASTTQDNVVKEQCKKLLIEYKDEIWHRQEKKVKEIFGEDIFK